MKLDRGGRVLWRRSFSRRLVLPTVSVANSGAIFILSQAKHDLVLQVLDSGGRLIRSRRIAALQGTVLANSDGGCTILCSRKSHGEDNVVSLIRLDVGLRQIAEARTPLVGRGGRDYALYKSPRGFLAAGACRAYINHGSDLPYAVAEFNNSGELLWQRRLSSRHTPLLIPFGAGFYLAKEADTYGEGTDVEKFIY